MERLKFKLVGDSPLILHNGQTADPLNRFSKELKKISAKRGKTDADLEQMAKIEWYASLYTDSGRVCIPGEVMEAALVGGARKQKLGKQAQAGLFVMDNLILDFQGCNLSIDELWRRDENRLTKSVRVGQAKVMRTRFWAKEWRAIAELTFDPELFNPEQISEIVRVTGSQIGLCDWRPKFGRFTAEAVG